MRRSRSYYSVLLHACIWVALFLCSFLLTPRTQAAHEGPVTPVQIVWTILPFIGIFYLHTYWLVPRFLFRKKRALYFMAVLMLIVGGAALSALSHYLSAPVSRHYGDSFARRIFPASFFILASASLAAFSQNFRLEKDRKEKETEHLRTELSFLRAQVNPHFMLNVLNSMALLARKKSDLLEPVLLELAGLMNYMLYETNNEKIRLQDEIEYLRSYIDLQLLRFGEDVRVSFNSPQLSTDRYVEPMLLIPIVENAFKHGIGLVNDPVIHIDIGIESVDKLTVRVKNKYNERIQQETKAATGIGLMNLKKRLELIYPEQYRLTIDRNGRPAETGTENWFEIALTIPLI